MIEYQNENYKLKMVRRAGLKLHLRYRTMISSVSNNFRSGTRPRVFIWKPVAVRSPALHQ